MTELDITQNPELDYLGCSNNKIATLDITQNPVLDGIDCSNNEITELDLADRSSLTILNCRDNRIKTLNIDSQYLGTHEFNAIGDGYIGVEAYAWESGREMTADAVSKSNCAFLGWYDTDGNLVSNEAIYSLDYDTSYTLEARFEEGEEPAADISATANEYGNVQFDYNAENDSLTLNMAPKGENYAVGAIYINGVEVAAGTGNTYVIENISSYADADGNIEIYVEFVQLTTEEPPKTGAVSAAGIAVALVAAGAAIVLLRKKTEHSWITGFNSQLRQNKMGQRSMLR